MTELNMQQKQLVFDYCMGQLAEDDIVRAERLISSSPEAKTLHHNLSSVLGPLESTRQGACPEALALRTIARLIQAKKSATINPTGAQPAAPTPKQTIKVGFWNWTQFTQVAAVAAIIMFLASVSIPSLKMAREKCYLNRCQAQFGNIYKGLVNYTMDHESPPTLVTPIGSPWWKVGYQGQENYSNTRVVWLLPRHGYVDPTQFLCPARRKTKRIKYADVDCSELLDFPGKDYIDYSSRIWCENQRRQPSENMVLMADVNPLSERIPTDYSSSLKIRLDESILNNNSINHGRRGQNVLLYSGSVGFNKTRCMRTSQDDIFSLRDMTCGSEISGCELPSSDKDAFLAP